MELVTEDCLENRTLVTNRGEEVVNITSLAADKKIKLLYELPPDLHCKRLRLERSDDLFRNCFLSLRCVLEWKYRSEVNSSHVWEGRHCADINIIPTWVGKLNIVDTSQVLFRS